MKPLTAIEALEGAIEMLQKVTTGERYSAAEYYDRLHAYEEALARHKAAAALVAQKQADIRSAAAQLRGTRA